MKAETLYPLQLLFFLFVATGFAALPARAKDASTAPLKKISTALQPFVDSHSLAGAVALVADRDKILDVEAVGFSDVGANKAMKTDALFWIASQSKPITATALMMLVDEGKVHLDDPVAKYLPEFNNLWLAVEQDNEHLLLHRPKHPITVRNILSHTSGLPFSSAMEQPTLDTLSLEEGVRSYAMTPLQYEPGAKYQYSNAGINTAGRIIEVVSGMPYSEFSQMIEKGNDPDFQQATDGPLRGKPRGPLHVAGNTSALDPARSYVVAATDYELEEYGHLVQADWQLSIRYDFPTIIREAIEEKLGSADSVSRSTRRL